jgi:hypothetical protein
VADSSDASVIGTDLGDLQESRVPPNLSFLVDNANQWSWERDRFDYIYIRSVVGGIQSWPELCQHAFYSLQDDGFLEFTDFHLPPPPDDWMPGPSGGPTWTDKLRMLEESEGIDFGIMADRRCARGLEEAGFKIVRETQDRLVLDVNNPEQKAMSRVLLRVLLSRLGAVYARMLQADGIPSDAALDAVMGLETKIREQAQAEPINITRYVGPVLMWRTADGK